MQSKQTHNSFDEYCTREGNLSQHSLGKNSCILYVKKKNKNKTTQNPPTCIPGHFIFSTSFIRAEREIIKEMDLDLQQTLHSLFQDKPTTLDTLKEALIIPHLLSTLTVSSIGLPVSSSTIAHIHTPYCNI